MYKTEVAPHSCGLWSECMFCKALRWLDESTNKES